MVVRVRAVVLLSSETRSASEKENYAHSLNGDYKRAVSSLASSGAGWKRIFQYSSRRQSVPKRETGGTARRMGGNNQKFCSSVSWICRSLDSPRPNKKPPAMQARIKIQYLPVTLYIAVTGQLPKIFSCVIFSAQLTCFKIAVTLYVTLTLPFPKGGRCAKVWPYWRWWKGEGVRGGVFNSVRSVFPHPHLKNNPFWVFSKELTRGSTVKKWRPCSRGQRQRKMKGLRLVCKHTLLLIVLHIFFLSISCHNKGT